MLRKSDVDRLRRDDVVFELKCRGCPFDGTLQEMRSRLRKAIDDEAAVSFTNINPSNLSVELSMATKLLDMLGTDLDDLTDISGNEFFRFNARLESLTARLNILKLVADSIPDTDSVSGVQQLVNKIKVIGDTLGSLKSSCKVDTDSSLASASRVNKLGSGDHEEDLLGIGLVSQGTVNQLPNVVASPGALMCSESAAARVSGVYAKLPHPAVKLLSGLPRADGFDVDILLKFLKGCISIKNSFPALGPEFLDLLIPYTFGPLHDCLLRHLNSNNFNDFHREALSLFVPARQYHTLKTNLFLRCQSIGEPLPSYILSVKEAAQVLLLEATESEVLNCIIEGLNPEVRSCLNFCNRPTTFAELDRLCVQVMNVQFTDGQRSNHSTGVRPAIKFSRPNLNNVVCHHCKEVGHIRPACPKFKIESTQSTSGGYGGRRANNHVNSGSHSFSNSKN